MPRTYTRIPVADRFWYRVNKTEGCWLWTGGTAEGYGLMHRYEGDKLRMIGAHRVSYELAYGPIPDGLFVLHHCDTPRCVRPDHLFLGTQADNMADATVKGRRGYGPRNGKYTMPECTPRGEAHGQSRFTTDQVLEIRRRYAEGETQRGLAAEFGVVKNSIAQIVRRITWAHV